MQQTQRQCGSIYSCLRKTHKSLQAPTARDCLVLHLMSDAEEQGVVVAGYSIMIKWTLHPKSIFFCSFSTYPHAVDFFQLWWQDYFP